MLAWSCSTDELNSERFAFETQFEASDILGSDFAVQWGEPVTQNIEGQEVIEYPIVLDNPDKVIDGSLQRTFRLLSRKINDTYKFELLRIIPFPKFKGEVEQVTYSTISEMIGIVGLYDVKGGLIDESYYNGKPLPTASENGKLPKAPRSYIPDPDNECYITLIFWEIPYYITATGQIIQGSYRVTLQHQMKVECEGGGTGDQGIQDIYTNVNYTNPLPCPGDPLFAPELAATARGGTLGLNGARDGLTRHYDYETETFNLPEHDGTDIKAAVGSSLYAMYGGTVTQIERNSPTGFQDKSWGNYIEIESIVNGETIKLKYNHLQSVTSSLSVNDNVNQGDLIGKTGRTGNAWNVPNPHVHIQAKELDGSTWKHRNPEDYMTTKFGTDHQPTNSNPCNN